MQRPGDGPGAVEDPARPGSLGPGQLGGGSRQVHPRARPAAREPHPGLVAVAQLVAPAGDGGHAQAARGRVHHRRVHRRLTPRRGGARRGHVVHAHHGQVVRGVLLDRDDPPAHGVETRLVRPGLGPPQDLVGRRVGGDLGEHVEGLGHRTGACRRRPPGGVSGMPPPVAGAQRVQREGHPGGVGAGHDVEVAHRGGVLEQRPARRGQPVHAQQGEGDDPVGVVVVDRCHLDTGGEAAAPRQCVAHDPRRDVGPQGFGGGRARPMRQREHRPGSGGAVHDDVGAATELVDGNVGQHGPGRSRRRAPRGHGPVRRSTGTGRRFGGRGRDRPG